MDQGTLLDRPTASEVFRTLSESPLLGFSSRWVGLRRAAELEGLGVFSMMDYCVLGGGLLNEGSGLHDAETEFSIKG